LLPEFAIIALTLQGKIILMHRSDEAKNSIDNFPQKFVFSIFSLAKSKNIVFFAFTFVLDSFGLFYGDFCMDLYGVDSDKGMKR
jgi:hypothetical protein